jgi:fatty-acyl-CoA synthase
MVRSEFGIDCFVELVPTRTLPRTSSGKLARARARLEFLDRRRVAAVQKMPKTVQKRSEDTGEEKLRYSA